MQNECYTCHAKTIKKVIAKYQPNKEISDQFIKYSHAMINQKERSDNPYLAAEINRLAKEMIHDGDMYEEEKHHANKILLQKYKHWENLIAESTEPLYQASKLAVAGNIIDYGAHTVPDDLEKSINNIIKKPFAIDDTKKLFEEITKSKKILYLGDNAGEIVFDRLFIETMQHPNVTFAVRGKPIINDVTFFDARQTGIDSVAKIISNGYDAPSTLLDYCSEEFLKTFRTADLIISKGQGNFEGLLNAKRANIFFLLITKCNPIAKLLNVNKGDMVVTKNK